MSKWQFDTVNTGQRVGWYPPGLTAFRDDQLKNLVREILQNSLDNPARKNQREPVVVEFERLELQRAEIPAMDDLHKHLTYCLKERENSAPEDLEDIREARKVANGKTVSVLRISDYNTSGMSGGGGSGCLDGSPFFNYIKTEGESGGNQSRGGSHGLGKNAPLVGSRVRAIFASTTFVEGGENYSLIQGRCQLRTRTGETGERLAPTGFWGGADFAPLSQVPEAYKWLERDAQGTSISIVGWSGEPNWEQLVACYAITNFFAAFKRKKLKVVVGNLTVDDSNLMELLGNAALEKKFIAHDKANNVEAWQLAKWLVRCVDLEPDQNQYEKDFQCPGEIGAGKLSLVISEGAPKKVAFIRANILITADIPGVWKRVPGSLNDFVGVYECVNDSGLSLLRRMEPPQHNGLNPDFLPWKKQKEGKRHLENLSKKLKEIIQRFAEIDVTDHHADNFTLEFFSDETGDGGDIQDDEDINPEGGLVIHIKPQNRPPPKPIQTEDDLDAEGVTEEEGEGEGDSGGAGEGGGGGGGGGGHGQGEGDGTGGTGDRELLRVATANALNIEGERFIRSGADSGRGKCVVQGCAQTQVEVILIEVGTDTLSLVPAKDIDSCSGSIGEKGIVVSTDTSGVVDFDFTLRRNLLGGLKILVNRVD